MKIEAKARLQAAKAMSLSQAAALADLYLSLHNGAFKEYKKAFASVGARMWPDDDAQLLRTPKDELAGLMKQVGTEYWMKQSFRIPLTVLDAYPDVTTKQRESLRAQVKAIHDRLSKDWIRQRKEILK